MSDVTRDATTGNWIAGTPGPRRTPSFSQTDLSVTQEFHLSKSNERLRARVGAECNNCLNQHSPTFITQNLIRTSGLNPAQCGTTGTNCTAVGADQVGFDYGVLMTKGFDYIGAANSQSRTLNSQYGQP